MLYYYKDFISKDEDEVNDYIAANVYYVGEEQLIKIQENEIGCINTAGELDGWMADNSWDLDDLEGQDISYEWLIRDGLI